MIAPIQQYARKVFVLAFLSALAIALAGLSGSPQTFSAPTNVAATSDNGTIVVTWSPGDVASSQVIVVVNVADDTDYCLSVDPTGSVSSYECSGRAGGATYVVLVIALDGQGGYAIGKDAQGNLTTLTVPAAAADKPIPAGSILSTSTTAGGATKLQLTISDLPADLAAGSSIELYLEDDFQVPNRIDPRHVYFRVVDPFTHETGSGARAYATSPAIIRNGDHFGGDDWAVQVLVPDMCNDSTRRCEGYNGPTAGQTLMLVLDSAAGIKNPSEAGAYSVGYSILGPGDASNRGPAVQLEDLPTHAKISLSDESNTRGYLLTVTGSGFNNGVTANVYVLHIPGDGSNSALWDVMSCHNQVVAVGDSRPANGDNPFCAMYGSLGTVEKADVDGLDFTDGPPEEALCRTTIGSGTYTGTAVVGSDDRVAVTFQVAVPTFGPGDQNYICMVDGEGRASVTDVEQFELQGTIRVSPVVVRAGDTVTVFAQDFANIGASFREMRVEGVVVSPSSHSAISADGSASATFVVPATIGGVALEGLVTLQASWGDISETTRIRILQ